MESIKFNKNAILQKKKIKKDKKLRVAIIDDFSEIIEVCGSNYSEKTVNPLKRYITK